MSPGAEVGGLSEPPEDDATARERVRLISERMIARGTADFSDSDQAAIESWAWRRAWRAYQKRFEASEADREGYARAATTRENNRLTGTTRPPAIEDPATRRR